MARVGVDPGDDKDGVPLLDEPAEQRFFRREVEDVEFVDPRRDDEERALPHALGGLRVLDELEEFVLEDHLARRRRQVLAELERRDVGLARKQQALAGRDIVGEHPHSLHEVLSIASRGDLQNLGVGEDEVRGRKRIVDLPQIEARLLPRAVVDAVRLVDQLLGPVRGGEVELLQRGEHRVLVPLQVGEAAVVGIPARRTGGADGALPDCEVAREEARLRLHQTRRVGGPVFADPAERLHDLGRRVGDEIGGLALLMRLQIGRERAPALLDGAGKVAREGFRVANHVRRRRSVPAGRPVVVRSRHLPPERFPDGHIRGSI